MLSSKVYNVDCSARAQDGCNRLVARKRSVIVHGRFGGREGRFYGRRPKDKSTIFVFISSYVLTAFAWRFEEINERLPLAPSFTTVLSIRWSPSLVISETYTNGMPRNWMSPSPCVYSAVSRRAHQMARFAAVFRFVFFFTTRWLLSFVFHALCAYTRRTQQINRQKTLFFFFFWKGKKCSNLVCVTYDFLTGRFVRSQSNHGGKGNRSDPSTRDFEIRTPRNSLKNQTSLRLSDGNGYWSVENDILSY